MPHMTDERVRAGIPHEEDLSLLNEVSMKTAGVSHLEMCIQCGSCGGLLPRSTGYGSHATHVIRHVTRGYARGGVEQ